MKNKTMHFLTKTICSTRAVAFASFLSLGLLCTTKAQTVSNPDFETLTTAGQYPTGPSQMGAASGWSQPTYGTCDYYYGSPNPTPYQMNISPTGSAPYTTITAQHGNAYAGGAMEATGSYASNIKEYITNKLSQKLVAGVTYDISFYTMHIYGKSSLPGFVDNYVDFIDAEKGYLGICFSSVSPTQSNTSSVSTSPSPGTPAGGIFDSWNQNKRALIPATNTNVYGATSRNNWVRVTLQYTADGTEEYMTIGQWRESPSAMPIVAYPNSNAVYYLFDNFSPVISPNAQLSKSVSPATIIDGGTATYTFTITNTSAGNIAQSAISFTDTLPSGLKIASAPNVVVTGLTGGTTTATAGGTSIVASGYSIAANTTATITVNVTNVPGQLNTSCGSNPAAFTNGASNISGLSSNLTSNVGNVCLVVNTACAAGTVAPVVNGNTN
ncbi:MAG: hypothetical protein DI539_28355 [Flavobacterium psychrophilum]|nr:MAG: hypothetical protein DI539_28355 [Flavobacterium psychrophilum]